MNPTIISILIGILVPVVTLIMTAIVFCIIRRLRGTSYRYDQISHELDEEEIEFKNMIETKGIDNSNNSANNEEDDDMETFFTDGNDEELGLNGKDKDRLNMLAKLRSNLVSGVEEGSNASESGNESERENLRL